VDIEVSDHPDRERFEARIDGELAGFVQYKARPDGIALTHTETLPEFGGRGVGGTLARTALEEIRARGVQVIPLCPFVSSYIKRHPEYLDLVVDRYRAEVTQ
jgi:predicted GNAT family acetyltransferase